MINGNKLVNAQVEVNRAVFLMNACADKKNYRMIADSLNDETIEKHIKLAIKDLSESIGKVKNDKSRRICAV